jgi:hypothetical protein
MSTTRVVWLHSNRRALGFGVLFLATTLIASVLGAMWANAIWARWTGAAVALAVTLLLAVLLWLAASPRLAFEDRKLLVFLRFGSPVRVPIDVVECFFLGQGPALLPRPFSRPDAVDETSTIVVRLAESAEEWKHLEVKPVFGLWCDAYITIRGTWCEPITPDLLKDLNSKLIEAHRELRSEEVQPTA